LIERQLKFQEELFGKIKTICQLSYGNDEFDSINKTYLCNANSGDPFYVNGDLFDDVSLTENGEEKYSLNYKYVNRFSSLVSFISKDQFFMLDAENSDEHFFKETGRVLVGNKWHDSGNHVAGSFGYDPVINADKDGF
jgi:hypothetical protein